jgi:predicted GNAT family acetyltransferase
MLRESGTVAPITVRHNQEAAQFEVQLDNQLAVLQYDRSGERLYVLHTEVPRSLAAHGIGSSLAQAALAYARAEGLLVVPHCPFMQHYLVQHPVDKALVDPAFRPPNDEG